MSVLTQGSVEVPIELVGGLYTLADPQSAPPGASPNCQDAEFLPGVPGTARTRSGLLNILQWAALNQTVAQNAQFNAAAGIVFPNNPTINYARTFRDQQQNRRNLYFDSLQNLWEEFPDNQFNIRGTVYQSTYVKSDTAFGREWLAFSDGKFGTDRPRQWDGTNLDPVSQDGPGTGPIAVDVAPSAINIVSITQPAAIAMSLWQVDAPGDPAAPGANAFFVAAQSPPLPFSPGELFTAAGTSGGTFDSVGNVVVAIVSTGFDYLPPPGSFPLSSTSGTAQSQQATVTTAAAHFLHIGDSVTIAGASVAGYDGTYTVFNVLSPTQFTFMANAIYGASGAAGTATPGVGIISAGVHQVEVLFVTRQGYITAPGPPISWTAAGSKNVQIAGIPIGPANVIARIIAFSAAGQSNFYYIAGSVNDPNYPGTQIPDNTTTSAIFRFSDVQLLSNIETNVDSFSLKVVLGEVAGFMQYFDRLFAWGERNSLPNFLNLGFDGGSISGNPTGWSNPTSGGSLDTVNTTIPCLAGYRMTGDGVTPQVGLISQGAYNAAYQTAQQNALIAIAFQLGNDSPGVLPRVPLLFPATAYSIRFRLLKGGALAQGTFHVNLSSVSGGGIQGTDAAVGFNDAHLNGTFYEYILPLCTAATFATTIPSDLVLQVYADGTPNNGGYFTADDIEIFPTEEPYNLSIVRASFAEDPESFDGTTGFLTVNTNDDQRITCLYPIRDRLRIAKEHGLFATDENPTSEPSGWAVESVSDVVGSATIHATGPKLGETGQDFALLVCREGVFFDYGQPYPSKINQEVQISNGLSTFNFDAVNWAYAHTAWVIIDMQRRRALIGLPMGNAQTPNAAAALDFRASDLDQSSQLATEPLVHQSTYTNKQVALSGARKWCPWIMTAMCAGMIERADGTAHLWHLGNGSRERQALPRPALRAADRRRRKHSVLLRWQLSAVG